MPFSLSLSGALDSFRKHRRSPSKSSRSSRRSTAEDSSPPRPLTAKTSETPAASSEPATASPPDASTGQPLSESRTKPQTLQSLSSSLAPATAPVPSTPLAPLLRLPAELLYDITSHLTLDETSHLSLSSRRLAVILIPELFKRSVSQDAGLRILHWAAESNQLNIVKIVLDIYGANVLARDELLGMTALHVAATNGHTEIVRELCRRAEVMEIQAEIQRKEKEKEREKAGEKVVEEDEWGRMTKGRYVNTRNKLGQNALYLAAVAGKRECVEEVMKRGGDALAALKVCCDVDEWEVYEKVRDLLRNVGREVRVVVDF